MRAALARHGSPALAGRPGALRKRDARARCSAATTVEELAECLYEAGLLDETPDRGPRGPLDVPVQQPGTLEGLALGIGRFFAPLEQDLAGGKARVLLANLGLVLPPSADGVAAFASSLQRVRDRGRAAPRPRRPPGRRAGGRRLRASRGDRPRHHPGVDERHRAASRTPPRRSGRSGERTGIPAGDPERVRRRPPPAARGVPHRAQRRGRHRCCRRCSSSSGASSGRSSRRRARRSDEDEYTLYRLHADRAVRDRRVAARSAAGDVRLGRPGGFDGSAAPAQVRGRCSRRRLPGDRRRLGDRPSSSTPWLREVRASTDVNPRGIEIKFLRGRSTSSNAVPFNQGGDWQLEALTSGNLAASHLDRASAERHAHVHAAERDGDRRVRAALHGRRRPTAPPFVIFGEPGGLAAAGRRVRSRGQGRSELRLRRQRGRHGPFVGGELRDGKLVIDVGGADGFIAESSPACAWSPTSARVRLLLRKRALLHGQRHARDPAARARRSRADLDRRAHARCRHRGRDRSRSP